MLEWPHVPGVSVDFYLFDTFDPAWPPYQRTLLVRYLSLHWGGF